MHSLSLRFYTTLSTALLVLMAFVALSAATSELMRRSAAGHITMSLDRFTELPHRDDSGIIYFSLHADLRPLWNWNVKQIFAWVSLQYRSVEEVLLLPLTLTHSLSLILIFSQILYDYFHL